MLKERTKGKSCLKNIICSYFQHHHFIRLSDRKYENKEGIVWFRRKCHSPYFCQQKYFLLELKVLSIYCNMTKNTKVRKYGQDTIYDDFLFCRDLFGVT
jgi:hypothetical protein